MAVLAAVVTTDAGAATFTVNTTQDKAFVPTACAGAAGDCALRQALRLAGSGGTIVLPAGHYTIDHELVTEEPDGADHDLDIGGGFSCPCTPVVIQGAGARTTIVDGGGTDRVFDVYDGTPATISGITVTGGNHPFYGGGIRTGGNTTIIDSTITGNTAVGSGGGIFNEADGSGAATTLINSTVSGNSVPGSAGVAPAGGGIWNGRGIVTIINSTISGNAVGTAERATARGGGIASNVSSGGSEGVVLRNATIHANSAQATSSSGGNISTTGFGSVAGTVRTANSIITGGFATTAPNCEGAAQQSLGFNFAGSDCALSGTGDIVGGDPQLKPLGDAGGPTDTFRPLPASPVLEKGDPAGCKDPGGAALATDQRGVTRPLGRCDIGAVELAPPTASADQAASAITQTTATLGGSAGNPFIAAGTTFVEFGLTTSYTRTARAAAPSPALTLPAGATAFKVSATIDKLTPDTTYHYRVVAINGDGTAFSPDATFKTLPTPVVTPPVVTPPPSRCASRRNFPIRLPKIPARYRAKIVSAKVTLGARTLAVVRGGRLRSKINLKNLPKGRFTLKITMKLTRGLKAVQVRRYKTCTLKLAHVPDPPKVTRA